MHPIVLILLNAPHYINTVRGSAFVLSNGLLSGSREKM